jgi:hypothetical protein
MFCAACIGGSIDALTTPRQMMPLVNGSLVSSLGLTNSETNWSYGLFVTNDW